MAEEVGGGEVVALATVAAATVGGLADGGDGDD